LGESSIWDPGAYPIDAEGPIDRPFQPCPPTWLDRPLFEIFAEIAMERPDKRAIVDEESYLTYREVLEQATRLARRIATLIGPGEPIAIALPNGASYPVAMLAALAAGRPYLPLDLSFPKGRTEFILKHSGVRAAIVDQRTRETMRALMPDLPQLDVTTLAATPLEGEPSTQLRPSADDVGFMLYTSGSTGDPKGVYFDQRGVVHDAIRRIHCTHLSDEDRLALIFAPTVSASQQDIFGSLLAGATLFIVNLSQQGLQALIRVMRRERITLLFCVGFLFRRLLRLCDDPRVFDSVRHVCIGGDRIFAADIELFRQRFPASSHISVGLGSSEANQFVHWFVPRTRAMTEPLVPVGYEIPSYALSLVGEDGAPVAPGEVGEMVVTGRYIALGYWNDPDLTEKSFGSAPGGQRRVFATGDLGRRRPDGSLDLIGRKDRQIKIRGNRVEPAEIEAVIRSHPDIVDAAIVTRMEGEAIEIAAYVVVEPTKRDGLEAEALSAWLIPRLTDAMRPRKIYVLDEIPILGNFKHDFTALAALDQHHAQAEAGKVTVSADAPKLDDRRGSVRDAVETAWRRLLGPGSLAADRCWEAAGGDSLKALELVFELEHALGRTVTMGVLGPTTSPSELIAALGNVLASAEQDRRAVPRVGARAQLFLLPGAGGPDLGMVRLSRALSQRVDVALLDYPRIDPADLRPVTLDVMIADITRQIRARLADGEEARLLGYSLGGIIAFETARLLADDGISARFVGALDSGPPILEVPPLYLVTESFWRKLLRNVRAPWQRRRGWARAFEVLVERQLQRRRYRLIARAWFWANRLGLKRAAAILRLSTTVHVRSMAAFGYRLKNRAQPVSVIKGRDNPDWRDLPRDLGWSRICGEAKIFEIPGDHLGLLGEHIETTCDAVLAAMGMKV
jgi:amino acid adenylation domain-containing protein